MMNMKILHLPLKAKWYEMIESGVKTEEYRETKSYWIKRLCRTKGVCDWGGYCEMSLCVKKHVPTDYTHVKFSYGYTKRTMTFEIESIRIGKGNPEWGAPTEDVAGYKNIDLESRKTPAIVPVGTFTENIYDVVHVLVGCEQQNRCLKLTLMRIFLLAVVMGIDIEKHIQLKMEYNASRPYKHGKKY